MLVMQARENTALAYPFKSHAKTAADQTQKRPFTTKPKTIQPSSLPAVNGAASNSSIFADRWGKHKTSPKSMTMRGVRTGAKRGKLLFARSRQKNEGQNLTSARFPIP
jgi:hypothetical protein